MKLDFSCDYGIVLWSKKMNKLGSPQGHMTNKIKLFILDCQQINQIGSEHTEYISVISLFRPPWPEIKYKAGDWSKLAERRG
jgi:hypothetical protein